MSMSERRAKRIDAAADQVISMIGRDGKHGSAILTWIVMQIAVIVAKKLLERIIADDGKQVVEIAKSLLDNVDDSQSHPFGDEE